MASSAARAPSMSPGGRQIPAAVRRMSAVIENRLEAEREQLVLWMPVMLAGGVALWFLMPGPRQWAAALLMLGGGSAGVAALARGGRLGRAAAVALATTALGLGLTWGRAEWVAHRVLAAPVVASFEAGVEQVEPLPARGLVRLTLRPTGDAGLPERVRVNVAEADAGGVARGAAVRVRARLMPPPGASLPGAYDYSRAAWFAGVGAVGRGFEVTRLSGGGEGASLRDRLAAHVQARLPGSAGGIAAALATGDVGAIEEDDAEAMRRAGLAHLLSVSGLHITAAVAMTVLAAMRVMALSRRAALRLPLPLIAAGAGAGAAIGYTLLTGAQVPTVRSCVAALLVLAALALGREAVTLRLVAAGAAAVLLIRPEAAAGASFQLSFAAITAIVALHEHPRVKAGLARQDEPRARRMLREGAALLLTGVVVEAALLPVGAYHFHKAGLYGAAANIVAIPLTTFVLMPLEALALALDLFGAGAAVWWLLERGLAALLALAHAVAGAPGAVAALPGMPDGAYALMLGGGLWVALWRTRWRRWGAGPAALGLAWALCVPAPDLLVTGDGRHMGVRMPDGQVAMLRERAGDYTQDLLAEAGGMDGAPAPLDEHPRARCSRDACAVTVAAQGRSWRVAATRSSYLLPRRETEAMCRGADVVVSDRRLPDWCQPRWLKLDRPALALTGGVAVSFGDGTVRTVRRAGDRHPWVRSPAP